MKITRVIIAVSSLSAVAACQLAPPPEQTAPKQPPASADACGARDVAFMAGMRIAEVSFDTTDRPVRIVGPNSAVTLDHRPERLNVTIDASERITGFACG